MTGTFWAKAFDPSIRTRVRTGLPAIRAGLLASLAAVSVAAGCSQSGGDRTATGLNRFFGSESNPGMETLENTVQYAVVPATRSMVSAPSALVVFERNLGGAIEQRIVLPNDTTVSGDNVLHVRAQTSDSARLGEFSFDEISVRFGGMPAPFERLQSSGLSSGSDGLGSYVYSTESVGQGTVCVLVMRRLGVGARPLPRGTRALDVVMRNCVNGTVQDALAPMGERALGVSGAEQSGIFTLSPHAAPQS